MTNTLAHMSHWGAFVPESDGREVTAVQPYSADPDPSSLLANIPGSVTHRARVTVPAIRRGWLESGPGRTTMRGRDEFVAVPWDEALDLLAAELTRVKAGWGNEAIFGGSYGWASAGLFHVPQYQLHRLLNCFGGYSRSVNSYSLGASQVILPHVLGSLNLIFNEATSWDVIVDHTELLVAFGGISSKNSAVAGGGVSRHTQRDHLLAAHKAGVDMVCVSPVRDDLGGDAVEWVPLVPGTDVALMAALAFVLATEGLHDAAFLDRYCVGYDTFERYLLGNEDGVPKTPEWAEPLTGIEADEIRSLARRMAAKRTLITVSWSLQRVEHGEQGPWMALALAAMLGQIGQPGGGFGHGYGSTAAVGMNPPGVGFPVFPQGRNPIDSFIPVARIADMLLHPGEPFEYDGCTHTYPSTRLVYWAGGNPFHHHQDLGRLRRALGELDTLVVHEQYWTGTARHADIVLPCTTTLERDDIGAMSSDSRMFAMHQVVSPHAEARDDHAIFAELAKRLGIWADFTEDRDAQQWLRHMYETWRSDLAEQRRIDVPGFDEFWEAGEIDVPVGPARVMLADFRRDPDAHPLTTPSGRIEITSAVIEAFGYSDCPGHPTWLEPQEWLGSPAAEELPLVLLANQPSTRLHSQLDIGATSQSSKVVGREPVRIHPADAVRRGIVDGDVVRVFNGRGSLLAGAVLSESVRPGAVQLSTGAWYDPLDPDDLGSMCVHGNPNVLTRDAGTSQLAQGCTGAHALVELERWDGPIPPVKAFEPPPLRSSAARRAPKGVPT